MSEEKCIICNKLIAALKEIRDAESECCHRCEGDGRLYADGKAHYVYVNEATVLCNICGGSGRLLPENLQDIAADVLTEVEEIEK